MPNTTKGYPYPASTDAVNVPGDIQALANKVDSNPGVAQLTTTARDALAGGDLWTGRVIYNTTTGKLQQYTGSAWADVDTTVALSSATPSALGVASAGSSSSASKGDHVHAMPSASDVGAIAATLVDAKGDVLTATADNTPARLAVGSNDTLLVADSTAATGLKWAALTAAQIPTVTSTKVSTVDINSQSASYTLVLGDASKLILMTSGSAQTVTIPTNASVAFPTGTKIDIVQTGAGQCDIAGASGVTLNSEGSKKKVNAQYQVVSIVKTATDTWLLMGALKA